MPIEFHPRGLADFNNSIYAWADKVNVHTKEDFTRITKNNVVGATLLANFNPTLVYRDGRTGGWHRDRLIEALTEERRQHQQPKGFYRRSCRLRARRPLPGHL